MSSAEERNPYDASINLPQSEVYKPRHKEVLRPLRFGDLFGVVNTIGTTACSLGMLDAKVFHSLEQDEDIVQVASDKLVRGQGYNADDYLLLTTNRSWQNSYSSGNGIVYASDFIVGLTAGRKNLSVSFDFVHFDDEFNFRSDETIPGIIWPSETGGLGVYRGKLYGRNLEFPRDLGLYDENDQDLLEAHIAHAESLLGTLALLGPDTEVQRTPFQD